MDIYIRDKDTPKYLRGVRVLDYEIMNELIQNNQEMPQRSSISNCPTHLILKKEKVKTKFLFSYYEDLNYVFKLGKLAGPAYRWFINEYPLNFDADTNGVGMYNIRGAEIWTNPKFDKQWLRCWAYDINSAYPAVLLKPIPDVNNELGPGTLFEGQVGFKFDDNRQLVEVYEGFANWRFNLIPSPWANKYVPKKYKELCKAKERGDKETAKKIKNQFNFSIGVLRNHNPFLYCHIITEARNATLKYVDENTISVNTDCIYSAVPRKDIPLGSEIGLFKELPENGNMIYFDGADYEWSTGKKSLRGIPEGLQATYNLETKTQIKKPDYTLEGVNIKRYDEN